MNRSIRYAAASLGAAVGSAGGGLLFDVTALPGASFILTAGLATIGFILSLKLPRVLGARPIDTALPGSEAEQAVSYARLKSKT